MYTKLPYARECNFAALNANFQRVSDISINPRVPSRASDLIRLIRLWPASVFYLFSEVRYELFLPACALHLIRARSLLNQRLIVAD